MDTCDSSYSRGCRCDDCRAAHAKRQREYYQRVGGNRWKKYIPAARVRCTGGCGARVLASRGDAPTCRKCLTRRKPPRTWCQGVCAECGDWFTRTGTPSPYCSARCGDRARDRERSGWISQADRFAIYDRDGWICQLCLEPVEHDLDPQGDWAPSLDHITPRSRGGSDAPENLRLAHRWCNSVRGDESYYTAADLVA